MSEGSGDSRTLGSSPMFGEGRASGSGSSGLDEPRTSTATVVPGGSKTARRPVAVGSAAAARKKGRRARLTVKRIDPWSTLKFSFVYGLAGLIVLLVAVVVLYGIVDAMGVISSLRSFFEDVQTGSTTHSKFVAWFGFGRVLLIAVIVGLVNVVLFTAFATLTAFIYNVTTDIVGGVEVTLAERN